MDRPARSGALPGAWDSYPPRGLAKNARVSFMEEMVCEFFVIMFESAYDKNFTNPSTPISLFFYLPARGEKSSQTTAPSAQLRGVHFAPFILVSYPRFDELLELPIWSACFLLEMVQVTWSFP